MSIALPRFLSPEAVAHNIGTLAFALGEADFGGRVDGELYGRCLSTIQGWSDCLSKDATTAFFFHGQGQAERAFDEFLAAHASIEVVPFVDTEIADVEAAARQSLALLATLDAGYLEVFTILVRTVLIARLPAYGGHSAALGIILAGIDPAWSRLEMAELLWHEAVHQAVFLEDLLNPLFAFDQDFLASPEACVTNPLLGTSRPFDLAFHGIAVSIAMTDLHLIAGSYRRAVKLSATLEGTIDRLLERRHLLTGTGGLVLDEIVDSARRIAGRVTEIRRAGEEQQGPEFERRSYLSMPLARSNANRSAARNVT